MASMSAPAPVLLTGLYRWPKSPAAGEDGNVCKKLKIGYVQLGLTKPQRK